MTVCGDVETETLGFVGEFSKAPERGREIKRDREGNVERERGVSVLSTYRADIVREERRKESWQHHKVQQVKLTCNHLHQGGSEAECFSCYCHLWLYLACRVLSLCKAALEQCVK